jgi:hypothetical protein
MRIRALSWRAGCAGCWQRLRLRLRLLLRRGSLVGRRVVCSCAARFRRDVRASRARCSTSARRATDTHNRNKMRRRGGGRAAALRPPPRHPGGRRTASARASGARARRQQARQQTAAAVAAAAEQKKTGLCAQHAAARHACAPPAPRPARAVPRRAAPRTHTTTNNNNNSRNNITRAAQARRPSLLRNSIRVRGGGIITRRRVVAQVALRLVELHGLVAPRHALHRGGVREHEVNGARGRRRGRRRQQQHACEPNERRLRRGRVSARRVAARCVARAAH